MPSSAVTRLNSITYAGFTVGAGTNYHLHGTIILTQDYTTLTLRFLVIVADPTEATFVSQAAALEAAFTTPNGDLELVVGGSTAFSLSQSLNTGMLGAPVIRKAGSSLDSNTSRLYSVSVTVQLPADEVGKSGRQSSRVSYASDGSEVINLSIVAVYTAIAGNGALAQAKSAFPGYVTLLQGVEGGTWDELDAQVFQHDSDDKFCQVSASFTQVIANQSAGVLNDPQLQGVQISVNVRTTGPGDARGSGAKRLQVVTVGFVCAVRRSQTTDLRNVFESKIRPHMIGVAQSLTGLTSITATDIRPGLNPQGNTINARMTFVSSSVALISSDVTTSEDEVMPFRFEPVLTGRPFDRDRHSRPGQKIATVTATILETDSGNDRSLAGFNAAIAVFTRQGYHVMRKSTPVDRRVELSGLNVTSPLRLRARRVTALLEFAIVVGGQR